MSNPLADFSHCSLPSTFVGIPSKRTSMTTTTGHLQTFIEHKEEGLQQRKDLASAKELSAVLLKEFKNFQSLLQDEQKHGSKKRKFFDDLSDTDSDNSNNTIQLNSFNAKIDFNTLVKSSLLHMQQRANQSFSSLTLTELSPKSFHGNHNSATTGNITPPAPSKKYTKKPKKPSITKELSNGTQLYKLNGIILDFKIPKNNAKTNAFHQAWKIHFDQLVDFRNRYGHTNVTRCTEGFEELGSWVSEQRRKLKNGKVTLEQFELLNQAGFEWDRSYYFHNTYKPNSEAEVQKSEKSPQQERQSSNIGAEALLSLAQPSGQPPVFPFK